MKAYQDFCRRLFCALLLAAPSFALSKGLLEIHYINVGQGGSTLIIGPNGTTIFYDFGNFDAKKSIIPFLSSHSSLSNIKSFDYAILSHADRDHYMGYRGLVEAGYDFKIANYYPEEKRFGGKLLNRQWVNPAKKTSAGSALSTPVGLRISLGDGAEFTVVASNGRIIGGQTVAVRDKNDSSVAALVTYGKFQYLIDGDLGAGPEDCTGRRTRQRDVQNLVAEALITHGLLTLDHGLDIMHIAHHGSESSTSAKYYNILKPTVGLMSVGLKNKKYGHPRKVIVENILLGDERSTCVIAPPLELLLQTEDGENDEGSTGAVVSNAGLSIGDISLTTDGQSNYAIRGTNRVNGGEEEWDVDSYWQCRFDEDPTPPPLCKIVYTDI